ncbi:MAG: hypothetical protein ACFFG0_34275 [Candidatus Thorarchaeota archaeon]
MIIITIYAKKYENEIRNKLVLYDESFVLITKCIINRIELYGCHHCFIKNNKIGTMYTDKKCFANTIESNEIIEV